MPDKTGAFDLEKDAVEKDDVPARNSKMVKDLEARLLAHVGAGQPKLNPGRLVEAFRSRLERGRQNI
jgi:hypothetical protein